jgi:REP element-mobilizing transposase RayT
MAYTPETERRRSIRLPNYDYALNGVYFITLVTAGRASLFGDIVDGSVRISAIGRIVQEEWLRSAEIRGELALDAFVIMPNHVHGVVFLRSEGVVASGRKGDQPVAPTLRRFADVGPGKRTLSAFVGGFKAAVTTRANALRGMPGATLWQRNYWERVIRDDRELDRAREYIVDNPRRWSEDKHNPCRPHS